MPPRAVARISCSLWAALALAACSLYARPASAKPLDLSPEAAVRDSASRASRPIGLWADAGMGGLAAPRDIRDRYMLGVSLGVMAGTRRIGPIAAIARFDFQDLPTGRYSFIAAGGLGYQERDFGSGRVLTLTLGPSISLGRGLFLEATAGGGYFDAGYGNAVFIDGLTGEPVEPPGHSGWGPSASAGLGFAFQPAPKQRMFADVRWLGFAAEDRTLHFVPLRIGVRFY